MHRPTRSLSSLPLQDLVRALERRKVLERTVISSAGPSRCLLLLSIPLLVCAQARAQQVRGVLQTEAPYGSSFVLRGTLPVPPNTYPRPDGLVPLAVRNSNGTLVPTQLEIVSRYANPASGADVVEVLARVDRPAGAIQGDTLQYQVVESPHPAGATAVPGEVQTFLQTPGSLLLIGTDAVGNRYRLDLLAPLNSLGSASSLKVLRSGPAALQMRTHGVLVTAGAGNGAIAPMPHLFGVHAYVTAWTGDRVLSLDLRVHNGLAGLNKSTPIDDALDKLYFKSLSLWVRSGWSMQLDVTDPSLGAPQTLAGWTVYPLIAQLGNGDVHLMPRQAEMHRRMAITKIGEDSIASSLLDQQGLGFARRGLAPGGAELWSWWNPATARYFPQKHRLPELDHIPDSTIKAALNGDYWNAYNAIKSGNAGNFPIVSPALGWAHPWGIGYGGATGGAEINLYDGFKVAETASRLGYRACELITRMYADRMPLQLWNATGEPIAIEQLLVQGPGFKYVPMNFYGTLQPGPDPFGFNQAPMHQVNYVHQNGLKPDYEQALLSYWAIDQQHSIRFTRNPKILAWLGNDALAKDELRHSSQLFWLSYHPFPKSSDGSFMFSGLLAAMKFAAAHPGKGSGFGRGEAWGLDTVVAAYSLGDPAWRARARPWLAQIADTLALSQIPCSGFIQAVGNQSWLGGQWRTRSAPEQSMTENALWGLKESVFRGIDPARYQQTGDLIADSTYSIFGTMAWAPQFNAPWVHVAVAPHDPNLPAFCGSPPSGGTGNGPDPQFPWSSFAYGHEITGDPVFLQKASAMGNTGNLLGYLLTQGLNNLESSAALLAHLQ